MIFLLEWINKKKKMAKKLYLYDIKSLFKKIILILDFKDNDTSKII